MLHIVVDYYFVPTFTLTAQLQSNKLEHKGFGVFIADLYMPFYPSITDLPFY
jgi:hypothetical protein